jgi:hypothetical protein
MVSSSREEGEDDGTAAELPSITALLRARPAFAQVALGLALSLAGDSFANVAVITLLDMAAPGQKLALGAFFVVQALSSVVISPFVGPMLDRMDRMRAMIAGDLAACAITFLLPFAVDLSQGCSEGFRVAVILVLMAARTSIGNVYHYGRSAVMPGLVGPENLVMTSTLDTYAYSSISAIAAALGGFVFSLVGVHASFALDAASYAASAYFTYRAWQIAGPMVPGCARGPQPGNIAIAAAAMGVVSPSPTVRAHAAASLAGASASASAGSAAPCRDTSMSAGIAYILRTGILRTAVLMRSCNAFSLGCWDVANVLLARRFGVGTDGAIGIGVTMGCFALGTGFGPSLFRHAATSAYAGDHGPGRRASAPATHVEGLGGVEGTELLLSPHFDDDEDDDDFDFNNTINNNCNNNGGGEFFPGGGNDYAAGDQANILFTGQDDDDDGNGDDDNDHDDNDTDDNGVDGDAHNVWGGSHAGKTGVQPSRGSERQGRGDDDDSLFYAHPLKGEKRKLKSKLKDSDGSDQVDDAAKQHIAEDRERSDRERSDRGRSDRGRSDRGRSGAAPHMGSAAASAGSSASSMSASKSLSGPPRPAATSGPSQRHRARGGSAVLTAAPTEGRVPAPDTARGHWLHGHALRSSTLVFNTVVVALALVAAHPVPYGSLVVLLGVSDSVSYMSNEALTLGNTADEFRGRTATVQTSVRNLLYATGSVFAATAGIGETWSLVAAGVGSLTIAGTLGAIASGGIRNALYDAGLVAAPSAETVAAV